VAETEMGHVLGRRQKHTEIMFEYYQVSSRKRATADNTMNRVDRADLVPFDHAASENPFPVTIVFHCHIEHCRDDATVYATRIWPLMASDISISVASQEQMSKGGAGLREGGLICSSLSVLSDRF